MATVFNGPQFGLHKYSGLEPENEIYVRPKLGRGQKGQIVENKDA
jgi:hypothetical protein